MDNRELLPRQQSSESDSLNKEKGDFNAEQILRDFVAKHIVVGLAKGLEKQRLQKLERFQLSIRKRLTQFENFEYSRYIGDIFKKVGVIKNTEDSEWLEIISASIRYELDNIDNTDIVPKDKQHLATRLGLDCFWHHKQMDIFPEVAKKIEGMGLKEMQDYFFPSGIMKVFPLNTLDDLGRLAEAALQRLSSDSESKEARAILEAVALQFKDRSFVRAYEFISVIENFSPEVMNEVMENFLEKKIKEKLFSAIFNFDRSQNWAISILSKYPRIYEAYQLYASEYQQRQEQERRNNAEREQKSRQENANAAIDKLIDGLIGEEGYELMRGSITPSLFLDKEDWSLPPISIYIYSMETFKFDKYFFTYVDEELQKSLYYDADSDKKERARQLWSAFIKKVEPMVIKESEEWIGMCAEHFYNYLTELLDLEKCNTLDQIKEIQEKAADLLERSERCKESPIWAKHQDILGRIKEILLHKQREAEARLRFLTEKEQREAKEEAEVSIKYDYIKDCIEGRINYLTLLYQAKTGLDMSDIGSVVGEESDAIGSVSSGMTLGLGINQEIRLEMLQEPQLSGLLKLKGGESIEELGKRLGIIDWVVPHEIGHVVVWALEEQREQLIGDLKKKLDEFLQEVEADDAIRESFLHYLNESFIDGIGFQLSYKYGTSEEKDILGKYSLLERLHNIIQSLITTAELAVDIMPKQDDELETNEQLAYYAFLLQIQASIEELKVRCEREGIKDVSELGNLLHKCQLRLAQSLTQISIPDKIREQEERIKEIYSVAFRQAEKLIFPGAESKVG